MAHDDEIATRRPVWIALSELFLDTGVEAALPDIARILAASPYPLEELRRILDDEVAPVLQGNLLTTAGEWVGFDENWLVQQVSTRLGKRRFAPLLVNLDHEWDKIHRLVDSLRAGAR